jgi:hypothetical protein
MWQVDESVTGSVNSFGPPSTIPQERIVPQGFPASGGGTPQLLCPAL